MITENLSTLKIHKLTKAQYERELAASRIDENAIYLTPDESDSKSIIVLKVPVLADGVNEYTETDKASVQTAISQIAGTDKPVVVLNYNDSYMPANYFIKDTHHYFTVIVTDKIVDESVDLYLIYIDYDTSTNTLTIRYDVPILCKGGGGVSSELEEDVETLKQQMANLTTINITSFTNNINIVEKGSMVTNATLNWKINKTPTTLTLDGGNIDVSLTNIPLSNLSIKDDKTWILKATDEVGNTVTKTTKITFLNGVYYGVILQGEYVDGDTISLLNGKELWDKENEKIFEFSVVAGAGEVIVFSFPSSYGTPVFKDKDTNIGAGFLTTTPIGFTNSCGYTEEYAIWISTQSGLGDMNVEVTFK